MSSSHQSDHEQVIKKFYTAFAQKDYATMQSLYHEQATFSDPVFQNLNAQEVGAMWQMLLTSARDLTVSFTNVKASEKEATCQWDAHYTFTRTGRKVHNIIIASFQFLDGKILVHRDHFEFRRWSRQAFGLTGAFLGSTSFFQNKVRKTARAGLDKFMQRDAR